MGILTLGLCESKRNFNQADFQFIKSIAERYALNLDNARLYFESQNAIRAREDILAIVSHDLKNPLTAIKTGNQLLDRLVKTLPQKEQLIKIIDTVNRSSQFMEMMISDLLDFSKIESGTLRLRIIEYPVKSILNEVAESFQNQAAEKSIRLYFDKPSDALLIKCDPQRIKQVLSNIISNAIKFCPENGNVDVTIKEDEEKFTFSVSDDGPGISK